MSSSSDVVSESRIPIYQQTYDASVIDPFDFNNNLAKDFNLEIGIQYDAYTILNDFMLRVAQVNPYIQDLSKICVQSTIECTKCGSSSSRKENYNILSVEINDAIDVQHYVDKFCTTELLLNEDAYYCKGCNAKTEKIKRKSIVQAGEIIILHLKQCKISFEKSMCFSNLDTLCIENKRYNLLSYIAYKGSLIEGHYIAYCFDQIKKQWVCFDDMNNELCGSASDFVQLGYTPYVLFYQY